VEQLSGHASPDDIEQLIQILENTQDDRVRADCALALGDAKATSAVPALVGTLEVQNWLVRSRTVSALASIGDSRAIRPLIGVLNEEHSDPNFSAERLCAIEAFTKLKSAEVVPVLLDMLTHNPGRGTSRRTDYTSRLLAALGAQGDKRAIPDLAKMLDGDAAVNAAGALGRIVGVNFMLDPRPYGPRFGPVKAKAWLREHPELLVPTEDESR